MFDGDLPINPVLPQLSNLVARANRAAAPTEADKIADVAKGFESVLLHKVMEQMQRTVVDSGLLDGGGMTEQVQGIFWHYLADHIAEKGGIGLGSELCRQMGMMAKDSAADQPSLELLR